MLRKIFLIFILILVQSVLAVTAGIAALSLIANDTLPPGLIVEDLSIGGLDRNEAAKAIDDHFSELFKGGTLVVSIDNVDYNIPYTDFNVSVDSNSTLESLDNMKSVTYIQGLIMSYFGNNKFNLPPVIKYDESKLRQLLIDLSGKVNKAPVNASILIKDGKVVKKAETAGYTMNIANTAVAIGKYLQEKPGKPLLLNINGNYDLQTENAKIMLKEFSDIEQVLAEYSTEIMEPELLESVEFAAKSIDGTILSDKNDLGNSEFSFVDRLKKSDKDFENDNEGYDQVASTLYAALLSAGIEKTAIVRLAHKLAVEYIEPGLDAWISGNGGDLKFKNTMDHKMAIFARVEGAKLTISLAGSLMDKKQAYKLETEIVQKFSPTVVNLENKELKPGEKILLNPGKEGLLVKVFRDSEFLYEDRYEAEKTIIQVGPGANLGNEEEK